MLIDLNTLCRLRADFSLKRKVMLLLLLIVLYGVWDAGSAGFPLPPLPPVACACESEVRLLDLALRS